MGEETGATAARKPRRGDEFEVEIEHLDARGRAIGTWTEASGEYRVFLRRGLPGERARVRVRRRRGDKLEVDRLTVLTPSPDFVEPRCAHFGTCGGCSFQDYDYAAQLALKRQNLATALAASGVAAEVLPTLPSAEVFGYRNKMDFTFANRRWVEEHEPEGVERGFALGLHVQGVWGKVLDVRSCEIQFERGNAILNSVRELARELELEPWDTRAHTGLLRHLVLREAQTTGELLVDLVTSREARAELEPFFAALQARHLEITTCVQNITARAAQVAVGEHERIIWGPGHIVEHVSCGPGNAPLSFEVSANSFFQTNTRQAQVLFDLVREAARIERGDVAWDIYCGAGFFALGLARTGAKAVIGFEWVEDAVLDARRNAATNGVANVEFVAGDLSKLWREGLDRWPAPDVCVVDPPRAGVHPSVLEALLELRPRRIVWVSCNLAAAVGDVARLVTAGYALEPVQPVDLFPHTPHVETVLTLSRPTGEEGPS